MKSVVSLNEAKNEAVLEANVTNLVAGTYTLSFQKGDAYEFPVEAAVVSKIEIISDVAVLSPDHTTQATARYQVLNQFGEDVTANSSLAAPNSKLTISGGEATSGQPGSVTFESTNKDGYRVNVDIVALTIVCNANGVNAQKTLTVSNKAVLDTVEFVGIYATNKSGVLEKVDLKEKTTSKELQDKYWALYSGKDQYGNPYNEPKASKEDKNDQLNVQITGIPGLTTASTNTLSKKKVNNVEYLAVKLSAAFDSLQAGTCTLLAIPTMSGKVSTDTVEVAPVAKIDTVTISTTEVLGGQDNSLEYEILDTEGKLVTNYEAIRYSGIFYDKEDKAKIKNVRVERKSDGTANIIYEAVSTPNANGRDSFSLISETNKVTFVTLTILRDSNPVAITAVSGKADGENISILSGNSIEVKAENLTLLDQHGKAFNPKNINKDNPLYVSVTVLDNEGKKTITHAGIAVSDKAVTITDSAVKLVTITGSGVAGTATFTVYDENGTVLNKCSVNLISSDITSVDSDVIITVPEKMYQGSEATIIVKTADGAILNKGQYSIGNDYRGSDADKIEAPGLPTGPSIEVTEKTFTISVTVAGKVYKQDVKYSNETPVVASAEKSKNAAIAASGSVITVTGGDVTVTGSALTFGAIQNLITVKNQYKGTDEVSTDDIVSVDVAVAKKDGSTATIKNNNTDTVEVPGLTTGDKVTIKYTFKGKYTSEQTFVVE